MVNINSVFKNIDELYPSYLALFEKMIRHETYSLDKEDIDSFGVFLSDYALSKGYHTTIIPFIEAGNGLLITMNEEAKLPPIVFCGHMDTVHPKGSFECVFHIENGKAYGPGTMDMKGGLLVGLLIMEALKKSGYTERPIKFIFVPDEERSEGLSGIKGKEFIKENAKGSAAAFTLEGSDDAENMITVGRKGSIRYRVRVQGVAAHAGAAYAKGRSAIKEASHKILDIEEASDPENITYNCGLIKGGTSPNTVPEFCEFYLYNRYWTAEQYKKLRDHVESILNKQYISDTLTKYEVIGERYPMEPSKRNISLAEEINKASLKYGFGEMKYQSKSSGSDASYTSLAGAPSVCSMGPVGGNAHMRNEFCYLDSIKKRAKLISATIVELPTSFGLEG